MYPELLKELIANFKRLPGIGGKTAERLAIHVVSKMRLEDVNSFGNNLLRIPNEIKYCQVCGMISDTNICAICSDKNASKDTIMVVSEIKDVIALEQIQDDARYYHVLGGVIDYSRGITENDLNIPALVARIDNSIKEIIIATDSTIEGEMTAEYVRTILADKNIIISRIAYGIPVGADLKYADEMTLAKAVANRLKY